MVHLRQGEARPTSPPHLPRGRSALLERTTSLIPGILQEDGVAVPGLGGVIEVGYGYDPAKERAPEEHALPDGRDQGAFGRWEAQRSKYDHAGRELPIVYLHSFQNQAIWRGMPIAMPIRSLGGTVSYGDCCLKLSTRVSVPICTYIHYLSIHDLFICSESRSSSEQLCRCYLEPVAACVRVRHGTELMVRQRQRKGRRRYQTAPWPALGA